ncbi:MAG: hypothetical protein JWM87_3139 [Candidatus Eremiobacteraeota bacterium]|nr:hypothetical protein [Candidatus Eremiobacteraeota bacterium]
MRHVAAIVLCLASALSACPVGADDGHYYPKVHGPPSGFIAGTLILYGQGMASGSISVREHGGKIVQFYIAKLPFRIDGEEVNCALTPRPPFYRREPEMCSRWPANVRVGVTHVRVPYWRGRRSGVPTLIAREFTVEK